MRGIQFVFFCMTVFNTAITLLIIPLFLFKELLLLSFHQHNAHQTPASSSPKEGHVCFFPSKIQQHVLNEGKGQITEEFGISVCTFIARILVVENS